MNDCYRIFLRNVKPRAEAAGKSAWPGGSNRETWERSFNILKNELHAVYFFASTANCPSGQEYDVSSGQCTPCAQGFYRTQNIDDVCLICPDPNFVTWGPGLGIADTACTLRKYKYPSLVSSASTCAFRSYYRDVSDLYRFLLDFICMLYSYLIHTPILYVHTSMFAMLNCNIWWLL